MRTKEQLYQKQSQIFSSSSNEHEKLAESWFDETTADFWLHNRMYEAVDCIAKCDSSSSWLTIGDGRWGLDSIRIKKRGIDNVLPTDICESLLKNSKDRGFIKSYSVENAEQLSFEDNSFDYIFCKESYHHFPRPYIALYEMLRVAKKAVFLVEPNDEPMVSTVSVKRYLNYKFRDFVTRKLKGNRPYFYGSIRFPKDDYEESGNYKYGISMREAQKIALGINLPHLVYKGLNTHYIQGCEFEPADIEKSSKFKKIKEIIDYHDTKCKLGLSTYSMLMIGIYKTQMDVNCKNIFKNKDWTINNLPRNPHL